MKVRALLVITTIAAMSIGCAGMGRAPKLGTETSFDGLVKVENPRSSAAWIRPDFDLSRYTHVKLHGAGIQYRDVRSSGADRAGNGAREFPISERGREQLTEIMEKAFDKELAKSERFEISEEAGPHVLLVWGGLLDVVSFVPPQVTGRGNIFLDQVGQATLVVELRDSESNTTLARMLDRRAAQSVQGGQVSNAVTNTAEVRRMASRWARLLRQRLDEAPTIHDGQVVDESPTVNE